MLNKVFLMGRLTRDPEIRYTSTNNVPIARFSLAVDRGLPKAGEEKQTDFINCIAWNKTAEFVNNYFSKGKMMVLNGRISTRSWDDADGKKRYSTEVVADEIYFGDSKAANTSKQSDTSNSTIEQQESEGFFPVDMDDELPF